MRLQPVVPRSRKQITFDHIFDPVPSPPAADAQTTSTLTGDGARRQTARSSPAREVTRQEPGDGRARDRQSDDEGRYIFPGLPVGAYEVRAEKAGFATTVSERVNLTVNETATLDIPLAGRRRRSETVTVTDEAALVNTQTHELSYLVGERAIRELPLNGRNYTDLALPAARRRRLPAPRRRLGGRARHRA